MADSYKELTTDISKYIAELRKEQPDTMAAFSQMAKAATVEGELDAKTKELVALAIGVAVRCDGCIGFHTKALHRLGATRGELAETLQCTEGAVRVMVHRLKKRYRDLLRQHIAHTVATPEDVDAEMQHLRHILAGS